jgi:hypothetical protein
VEATDREHERLTRVLHELDRYEHPWFEFGARLRGEAVEVSIQFKPSGSGAHTYRFEVHPRDVDHAQFTWIFQKLLYDCLHDYVIEMFARNPQKRETESSVLSRQSSVKAGDRPRTVTDETTDDGRRKTEN